MKNKIIVDCDGVLLDWAYAFDVWMVEQGFRRIANTDQYYEQSIRYSITDDEAFRQIKRFNESGCVGFIPALRDSVEYVTKLNRLGWDFEVISCLDKDKYAQKLREKNLRHIFGDVFSFIDCALDFTKGKEEYLLGRYSGMNYYWIEDSISHAESGFRVGLRGLLMDHPYNQKWDGPRVKNWKEVYEIITNADTTY